MGRFFAHIERDVSFRPFCHARALARKTLVSFSVTSFVFSRSI